MAILILTPEELEIYKQIKQRSGAKSDDELIRWLFHDWKRMADEDERVKWMDRPGRSNRDLYSSRAISLGGGLTAVDDDKHKSDLDDLGKIDLGNLGDIGGAGGIGGIG